MALRAVVSGGSRESRWSLNSDDFMSERAPYSRCRIIGVGVGYYFFENYEENHLVYAEDTPFIRRHGRKIRLFGCNVLFDPTDDDQFLNSASFEVDADNDFFDDLR